MAIQNIKRWQWILIGLVLGLGLGYVNQSPRGDWKRSYGEALTQHQFEQGLARRQGDTAWFHDLVVYPEQVDVGGKGVALYVVAGEYFDGRPEIQGGKRVAVWRPRCFVAETPFVPIAPPANPMVEETVLAYLKTVPGATFRYAWWRDPKWGISLWIGGCVLVVGLIWPTVINLLVFGSITRPREAKIDLSKVSSATAPQAPAGPPMTVVGDDGAITPAADPQVVAGADAPAAPRPLSDAPLEPDATAQEQSSKDFGQDEDDFYPTERHAPHR